MKKLLSFLVMSLAILSANAKIWRVNKVPGIAADFSTAQAAHDAAAAGDTIYLEAIPGNQDYGNLTTTKKLTWIGLGDFLGDNTGLQFSNTIGSVGQTFINAGSEGSVFQIVFGSNGCGVSAGNITFIRCRFPNNGVSFSGAANHIIITQSFINGLQTGGDFNYPSTFFTITNNLIVANNIQIATGTYQVVFNNNTFISSAQNPSKIHNATVANNIFVDVAVGNGTGLFDDPGYPSTVNNNTWVGSTNANYVGKDGNTFAANAADVFAGGTSPDAKYKLAAGSPAIGTGAGGVDRGAYGGANPYVVSLIPAIPTIYQLSVTANATGGSLPVTVSTRANN
jgi:hypothetical protein